MEATINQMDCYARLWNRSYIFKRVFPSKKLLVFLGKDEYPIKDLTTLK